MYKKILLVFTSLVILLLCGCSNDELTFENNEYEIRNGDYIKVKNSSSNVKYKIVGNETLGITLSEDGMFTFDTSISNYTQVLVIATKGKQTSNEVVCTLVYDYLDSTISFKNKVDSILDSEYITASDSNGYGITYSIEPYSMGVSIDSSNGKVSYTDSVTDNQEFTVYARSGKNNVASHTYKVLKDNVVKTTKNSAIGELENKCDVNFTLDYSLYSIIKDDDILTVTDKNNNDIDKNCYSYNHSTKNLIIKSNYIQTLGVGSHTIKIVTKRNAVSVNIIIATKFIDSVEDLVSINDNEETLAGYYIQTTDLDLTDYLKIGGKYYNKGWGWTPIGTYHDSLKSNEATKDAFTGTYDGNGHVIKGLKANRIDEQSFNFGLFGYITSSATIKNLGVEGSVSISSYSGGLCGTNNGVIENCYSNVSVVAYTGKNTYRYLGGLVGNNLGTISNSYSYGMVKCDTYYGQLVGYNEGKINNSFSYKYDSNSKLCGLGTVDKTCMFFDTLDDMKNYDYSNYLKSPYWKLNGGSLPTLESNLY